MRAFYISRIILMACTLCMVSSCVLDRKNDTAEPVDLRFEVGNRSYGSEAGSPSENKMVSVRVMAFNPDGKLEKQEVMTNPAGFSSVPVGVEIEVRSGHKKFCIIANEPSALTPSLAAVSNLAQMEALDFGDQTTYNSGSEPLPMATMKTEFITSSHVKGDPLNAPIKRAVGMVRMKITKENGNQYTTKLLSVQLRETPTRTKLMDGSPLTGGGLTLVDMPVENTFSPDIITETIPLEMTPLYLYEHYWGKGTEQQALSGNATNLVVVISVERIQGTWTNETYEFPLIGSVHNGEKVYEVRRNTIADFNLVVAKEGMQMDYNVNDWDEVEYGKKPGENDTNTRVEDWVLPTLVEYEHELN